MAKPEDGSRRGFPAVWLFVIAVVFVIPILGRWAQPPEDARQMNYYSAALAATTIQVTLAFLLGWLARLNRRFAAFVKRFYSMQYSFWWGFIIIGVTLFVIMDVLQRLPWSLSVRDAAIWLFGTVVIGGIINRTGPAVLQRLSS